MRELVLTNDPVLLNFAQTVLRDAGIETFVFDQHISMAEGSIGAFPRRLMVAEAAWDRACKTLDDAGIGDAVAGRDGEGTP